MKKFQKIVILLQNYFFALIFSYDVDQLTNYLNLLNMVFIARQIINQSFHLLLEEEFGLYSEDGFEVLILDRRSFLCIFNLGV